MPPFQMDCEDSDFRAQLSAEQLDALERQQRAVEPVEQESRAQRAPVRMVGADRPRIERGRRVD